MKYIRGWVSPKGDLTSHDGERATETVEASCPPNE